MQPTLKSAFKYHERRFCVIPVKYGGKNAEINWKQFQTEKPGKDQIREWFGDGQKHNLGVVCGKVSGGLVVLVFNRDEDFKPFFNDIDILNQTPVAHSKRGAHVYLRTDDPVDSRIYPGARLEVKSDGTYVVAPPSLHPSGVHYRWLNPNIKEILRISDFNTWLRERALRIGIETVGLQLNTNKPEHARFFRITPERLRPVWVDKALQGIVPVNGRNLTCFKLACYLYQHYPKQDVTDMLFRWAKEKCEQPEDNPFTEKEVTTTIESAYNAVMRRTK